MGDPIGIGSCHANMWSREITFVDLVAQKGLMNGSLIPFLLE